MSALRGLVGGSAIGAGALTLAASYWWGLWVFAIAGVTLAGFGVLSLWLGGEHERGP